LYANTAESRDDWMADLERSIAGTHPNDLKDASLKKQTEALVNGAPDVKRLGGAKGADSSESSGEEEEETEKKARAKPKTKADTLKGELPRNRSKSSSAAHSTKSSNKASSKHRVGTLLDFDPFAPVKANSTTIQSSPGFVGIPAGQSGPVVNPFLSSPGISSAAPFPSPPQAAGGLGQQNFHVPNANQNPFAPLNQFKSGMATNPFLTPQQAQAQNFDAQAQMRAQNISYQPTGVAFASPFQPVGQAPNPFAPQPPGFGAPMLGAQAQYGGNNSLGFGGQTTNNLFF